MAYTAIDDPSAYFKIVLWTGTGSDQDVTGVGFASNLIWLKERSHSDYHFQLDTVRGKGSNNHYYNLYSNATNAETDQVNGINTIGSDGFSITTRGEMNETDHTYVAWCWSESATAGFDIVGYTGNGTDDTDISHNLSAVPKMIIVKNRDAADAWQVYHGANTAAPETDYLVLNTTAATVDDVVRWSDEAPTSSVFTLGSGAEVNTDSEAYIAYCFAEKQGFSKFGSYLGNANVDGVFVYTGFTPALLMIKPSSGTTGGWTMYDTTREPFNDGSFGVVTANQNNAESTELSSAIDILSNGYKIRGGAGSSDNNASGATYVYMAFAEAPFVNSNGVPCNAR